MEKIMVVQYDINGIHVVDYVKGSRSKLAKYGSCAIMCQTPLNSVPRANGVIWLVSQNVDGKLFPNTQDGLMEAIQRAIHINKTNPSALPVGVSITAPKHGR